MDLYKESQSHNAINYLFLKRYHSLLSLYNYKNQLLISIVDFVTQRDDDTIIVEYTSEGECKVSVVF